MKKLFTLLKQNKYIALGVVCCVILVVVTLNDSLNKPILIKESPVIKKEEEAPVITGNEEKKTVELWRGIIPGRSKVEDVQHLLGNRLSKTAVEGGKLRYTYDLTGKYLPIVVVTNLAGVIQYMDVPQTRPEKGSLDKYINQYGLDDPSFESFIQVDHPTPEGPNIADGPTWSEKRYVYLNNGISFTANQYSREVHYIQYFVPMDKGTYIKLSEEELTETHR